MGKIFPYVGATTPTLEIEKDTIQLSDCSVASNHGCADDVKINPSSQLQVHAGNNIVMKELTNNHGITIGSGGNSIGGNLVIEDDTTISGKLTGVYYNWVKKDNSPQNFDAKRHVGVIAQEVKKVLPEVVGELYGGEYLGVDYPALIPLLIEAMHELDDKVAALATNRNLTSRDILDHKAQEMEDSTLELKDELLQKIAYLNQELEVLKLKYAAMQVK